MIREHRESVAQCTCHVNLGKALFSAPSTGENRKEALLSAPVGYNWEALLSAPVRREPGKALSAHLVSNKIREMREEITFP